MTLLLVFIDFKSAVHLGLTKRWNTLKACGCLQLNYLFPILTFAFLFLISNIHSMSK